MARTGSAALHEESRMTISVRQLIGSVLVSFCAGTLITPVFTQTQATSQAPQTPVAASQTSFMLVEFMKVAEGKEAEWIKAERETWKPMHTLRVKDGGIQSWAAISQWMPGDESQGSTYATVTTFRGWPDPTKTNYEDLFKRAHPGADVQAAMDHTQSTRSLVRSEIWQVLEQTNPTVMSSR
jgi:hypothetical protein